MQPNVPIVPKPDPKLRELEKQIEELKKAVAELKSRKPVNGKDGKNGDDGKPGKAGRGITSARIIDKGEDKGVLVITFSDGETKKLGVVIGQVDVVISVDGKEQQRANGVKSGSVVRIPVRRILIEEK